MEIPRAPRYFDGDFWVCHRNVFGFGAGPAGAAAADGDAGGGPGVMFCLRGAGRLKESIEGEWFILFDEALGERVDGTMRLDVCVCTQRFKESN